MYIFMTSFQVLYYLFVVVNPFWNSKVSAYKTWKGFTVLLSRTFHRDFSQSPGIVSSDSKVGIRHGPLKRPWNPGATVTLNHGDKCREVAPLWSTHLPFQTRNQPLAGDSGGGGGVSGRAFLLLSGIRGEGSTWPPGGCGHPRSTLHDRHHTGSTATCSRWLVGCATRHERGCT